MTVDKQGVTADRKADEVVTPIRTGEEYIESLRGRNLNVYLFGERLDEPVDHPIVRPSINAVAETYDLAVRNPELASAMSPLTGERINRFLHIADSAEDLIRQNKMQRRLGQLTGTCFQRCVGMDAMNALHSVTFEIDAEHGGEYHDRFNAFVKQMQRRGYVIGGAMTDVKGDRGQGAACAGRSGPVRAYRQANRRWRVHQRHESPSDRLHQCALAACHADNAPGSR